MIEMDRSIKELIDSKENRLEFQVNEKEVRRIDKSVKKESDTLFLSTKKFIRHENNFEPLKLIIIYQDLSLPHFLEKIEELFGTLFYPLYFHRIPIYFLSKLEESAYQMPINKDLLHHDISLLKRYLLVEQTMKLLTIDPRPLKVKQVIYPLENLNDNQMQATNQIEGPIRLIAPAGSGKTKTLVNRIANLRNHGIDASKILALTFNKKAKMEMEERLQRVFQIDNINVKTFHSLGNDFLENYLHYTFEENEQRQNKLLIDALKTRRTIVTSNYLNIWKQHLSKIKNELMPESEMIVEEQSSREIFYKLQESKRREGIYNYDDMLYEFVVQLIDKKYLRQWFGEKYQYILVDEFQDLNSLQLLLLELLGSATKNIFIVGDDDQMIYSFRGAQLSPIQQFQKTNRCLKSLALTINYRSTTNLIELSKCWISLNRNRFLKTIIPAQNIRGEIKCYDKLSLVAQAKQIAHWIKQKKCNDNNYQDFAVLYRYNKYHELLAVLLEQEGIPLSKNKEGIWQTTMGRCIQAYFHLLFFQEDLTGQDFQYILWYPNRYFSREFINQICSLEDLLDPSQLQKLTPLQQKRYQCLLAIVEKLKYYSEVPFNPLLEILGLQTYAQTSFHVNENFDYHTDSEILTMLQMIINQFSSVQEFYQFYREKRTKKNDPKQDEITLSTVHKSKGNEYSYVAYFNLQKESTIDDIEEERRIIYVGLTRAKKALLITSEANTKDQFLQEITKILFTNRLF